MRWPIQLQLLLANLGVAGLAVVLLTVMFAYRATQHATQLQEERLQKVEATIRESTFPLTDAVLRQMTGLSGAEFVTLSNDGRVQHASISLSADELARMLRMNDGQPAESLANAPFVRLGASEYFVWRTQLTGPSRNEAFSSLIVLYPKKKWETTVREAAYPPLMIGAVVALIAVVISWITSHRLVRSIHDLRGQTETIASGDFRTFTIPRRNDELRDLSKSINDLSKRLLQYEHEVRRAERLKTLDQLGAGIAHQFRNSATGARMALQLHQSSCPKGEEGDDSLRVVDNQLQLMESYIKRFLDYGRSSDLGREPVPLQEVIEEALALARPRCAHANIQLEDTELAHDPLLVRGNRDALVQLVINLLTNALDAAEASATLPRRVVVCLKTNHAGEAILRIGDSGGGLSPEIEKNLFEPFESNKTNGIGLGLAIAKEVATSCSGDIQYVRDGNLTWFVVVFRNVEGERTNGACAGG